MFAIIKKELKNYFFTPVGYIVIGIFLTCFSAIFFLTTIQTPSVDLTNLFYGTAIYGSGHSYIFPWVFSISFLHGWECLIF